MTASPYQPISGLSGGNAQKAVLARPALRNPKVLIVDEPTQGVDAKARLDIYRVLADAAEIRCRRARQLLGLRRAGGPVRPGLRHVAGTVVEELAGPDDREREIVRSFVSATDVDEEETALPIGNSAGWAGALAAQHAGHTRRSRCCWCSSRWSSVYTGTQSEVFWSSVQTSPTSAVLTLPLAFVALGQQFAMIVRPSRHLGRVDDEPHRRARLRRPARSVAGSSILSTVPLLLLAALWRSAASTRSLIEELRSIRSSRRSPPWGSSQGIAILLRPESDGVIAPELVTRCVPMGFGFVPLRSSCSSSSPSALEFWLHRAPHGARAPRARIQHGVQPGGSGSASCGCAASASWSVHSARSSAASSWPARPAWASNSVGAGYTLPCFAAVFLGGAVLTGGRGSFIGAMLGALFLP